MQALESVMQNPNEVLEPRRRGRLGRIILMISFWSSMFVRSYEAGRRQPVSVGLSRPVHTLTGPVVTSCMWGGKDDYISKERAVGVLEGTGDPLCSFPHHTWLALSPGKKSTCF